MAKVLLFCVISSLLCYLINGSCSTITMQPGSESCHNDELSLTLPLNSYALLSYPHCKNCTCSNGDWSFITQLTCCGHGYSAGVFAVPGCTVIQRPGSCEADVMDAANPSQPCPGWSK